MKSLIPFNWGKKHPAPQTPDRWWENPLESFFGDTALPTLPGVDVTEDKKNVTVKAEVPGLEAKDIDLSWENGILRIRGEKKEEKTEDKKGNSYRECRYGYFSRDVAVGKNTDWEKAAAKCKNGVLTVKLPKTAEEETKAVAVKIQ